MGEVIITQQHKEGAEYLEILSKQLLNDFVYKFSILRNINKNGYSLTSAKRLLKLGIDIPSQFIIDNKIQVGDLFLTQIDKQAYHKLKVEKHINKIKKSNEFAKKMLFQNQGLENIVSVPADIYEEILDYFKEYPLSHNLVITKGV